MKHLRKFLAVALLTLAAFTAHAANPVGPGTHLFAMLKDGSSDDMVVDGSSTPVEFDYQVPTGKRLDLERINIVMTDTNILNDKFGGLNALTNGLTFEVIASDGTTVLFDFTADKKIRTNTEFAFYAGSDADILGGGLVDALLVRWTISKAGAPIRLTGGQYIRCTVNDALAGLVSLGVMVQGIFR